MPSFPEGRNGRFLHGVMTLLAFGASVAGLLLLLEGHKSWGRVLLFLGVLAFLLNIPISLAELGLDAPRDGDSAALNLRRRVLTKPNYPTDLGDNDFIFALNMMINPRGSISRIRVFITPLTRALQVQEQVSLSVPAGDGASVLVPVVRLRKGRLLDDLTVKRNGEDLPVLAFSDYVHWVMAVFDKLARTAGLAQEYKRQIRKEVRSVVSRRSPITGAEEQELVQLRAKIRSLIGGDEGRLMDTCLNLLSSQYFQLVAVRRDQDGSGSELFDIRYRKIQHINQLTWKRFYRPDFIVDRLRAALGIRPSAFSLPLDRAADCASFHLEFMGPQGSFLARQEILGTRDRKVVDFSLARHAAYRRNRRRLGQRYSHVYLRRGTRHLETDAMRLYVSYFERMPGSVGAAAVAAVSSTVLLWAGAYLAAKGAEAHGDVVAILLAFPGIASAWTGLDRSPGILGGVLAARLTSLLTAVFSVIGAVSILGVDLWPGVASSLEFYGARGGWSLLVAASTLVSIAILATWLRRSIVYSCILNRYDPTE